MYKAKLFSYQHGAATLLDVLNAQKAQNDVRLAYVAALDERAKALIGVEQGRGHLGRGLLSGPCQPKTRHEIRKTCREDGLRAWIALRAAIPPGAPPESPS